MKDIQDAMCTLLGDSDEMVQELASRGISAIYHLITKEEQKILMEKLVSSLSGTYTLYYLEPKLFEFIFTHCINPCLENNKSWRWVY